MSETFIAVLALIVCAVVAFGFVKETLPRWRHRRWAASLEHPWSVLALTSMGVGFGPGPLRAAASMSDDDFEDLYAGVLLDKFWHQGTIWFATPYAVDEIMRVLSAASSDRQRSLLEWVEMCLKSELAGDVQIYPEDREITSKANVLERKVVDVVRSHANVLDALRARHDGAPDIRELAERIATRQ